MWLTPKHLAGLPGLPASEKGARDWLQRHRIPSRPRQASGGGMEYDCAALPAKARAAVAARTIARATTTALAQVNESEIKEE